MQFYRYNENIDNLVWSWTRGRVKKDEMFNYYGKADGKELRVLRTKLLIEINHQKYLAVFPMASLSRVLKDVPSESNGEGTRGDTKIRGQREPRAWSTFSMKDRWKAWMSWGKWNKIY